MFHLLAETFPTLLMGTQPLELMNVSPSFHTLLMGTPALRLLLEELAELVQLVAVRRVAACRARGRVRMHATRGGTGHRCCVV